MLKKNVYLAVIASSVGFLLIVVFLLIFKLDIFIPKNSQDKITKTVDEPSTSYNETKKAATSSTPIAPDKNSPLGVAVAQNNADGCLVIENEKIKNQCVTLAAEQLNNKELCLKIKEEKSLQNCQDRAIYKQAIENKKISLCLEIKNANLNQSCIIKMVSQEKDLKNSDCDALPDKEKKYCSDYLVSQNDYSVYEVAKNFQDCDKIVNPGIKDFCTEKFVK